MKYKALVVYNDPTDKDCPYPGCIKVKCQKLFGFKTSIKSSATAKDFIDAQIVSSCWIRPHYAHPMDFYLPEVGEGVYIEFLADSSELIWTGVYPGVDYTNYMLPSETEMEGINENVVIDTTNNFKTRIFGTRFGSHLIFEDAFRNDIADGSTRLGKMRIVVGGPNKRIADRVGLEIIIDSLEEEELITILSQAKDGTNPQKIEISQKTDTQYITLNQTIDDTNIQTVLIDGTPDAQMISLNQDIGGNVQSVVLDGSANAQNITVTDMAGQTIKMDSTAGSENILVQSGDNTKISMKKDGTETIVQNGANQQITMATAETVVQHSATQKVTMDSAGVAIENGATQKIEMGAASIKVTGAVGSIEVL